MKVLLVNASPHNHGRTARSLCIVEKELQKEGIETFWFQIGSAPVRGCIACGSCVFHDDKADELIEDMVKCNGTIIGSPVYFAGPNGALLALPDRAFYALCNYGQHMREKPGAALVSVWREGGTAALDRLNKYYLYSQMPVVAGNYWPVNWNDYQDGFAEDVLKQLGINYADMLLKLHGWLLLLIFQQGIVRMAELLEL